MLIVDHSYASLNKTNQQAAERIGEKSIATLKLAADSSMQGFDLQERIGSPVNMQEDGINTKARAMFENHEKSAKKIKV